jgi:hypothetical protein
MNTRPRICLILVAAWFCTNLPALAAEPIILRTTVTPEDAWLSQKVTLHVDVLAKDGWAQIRKTGSAEVRGAYLLRLETQGTRLNETIDGDSYTGQRYEFMLFAQRAGEITVPPMPVDVEIRSWGADGGIQVHRLITPVVEFVARTPPGGEGIQGLISTSGLTANQVWDPEPDTPQVGDAVKRTITMRAADVSGIAFAPMLHSEIEDLGIYPGEPTVEDNFARGALTGTRIETVTYVFERPGEFALPGIVLNWWDVRNSELRRIELPGLSLQVSGDVTAVSVPADQTARQAITRLQWTALLASLLMAALALRFRGRLADHWAAWRKARSDSEATYFRRVLRSLRSGDQETILRDTMRWLDCINDSSRPAQLDQFMRRYGDPGAQAGIPDLMNRLAADRDKSNTAALSSGLKAARKRWRRAQRARRRVTGVLPELNGTG